MIDIDVQREILIWGYEHRYEKLFEITEIDQLRNIGEPQKFYNVDLLVNLDLIKYEDGSGNLLSMTAKGLKLLEQRDNFDRQFPSKKLSEKTAVRDNLQTINSNQYDAFIAHASEDKEEIARPTANLLKGQELKIWYDEFTLRVGDSLRRSIDKGLTNSRFGIVILSPSFFNKEWPQRELDGLTAREVDGKKVILPIWHKVTYKDVVGYSPTLADRVAAKTADGLPKV
jgi:hypothetical protein